LFVSLQNGRTVESERNQVSRKILCATYTVDHSEAILLNRINASLLQWLNITKKIPLLLPLCYVWILFLYFLSELLQNIFQPYIHLDLR